jgi:DNA-binding response OmpR family regulator
MSKVLVIEDDAGILSSLSLYLRKSNYEPILCSNGFDAISLFNKHNPDIVILDINLPGRD